MAALGEASGGRDERPFPPGEYPLVVVGSGPGAIQVSYALGRLGVRHAVLSADPAPGGMFRRFPFFQRLLSWTKPYAPAERGSRAYERYDWNSLLADEPEHRSLMPGLMDGASYFPSRPEMERNLRLFAERTGVRIRHDCRWERTRLEGEGEDRTIVLETSDGEYRCSTAVIAVGVAEPYKPATPGIELVPHYVDTRPATSYRDRRVFIIGKQNSGFELASGLLQEARSIVLASPSPARLSVVTHSLVGIRARYVQPYEDHVLGGGVAVLEAAIERIERDGEAFRVVTRPSRGGDPVTFEADDVIAATGFVTPLLDLPSLGVATFGQSRLPAQTPFWESATVPGIFFAGTISQGAAGLKKHGLPANSGAVHGARYNARVLARRIAETRFGVPRARPALASSDVLPFVATELRHAPELFHQRAYLARVVSFEPATGIGDDGVVPLAWFLDSGGPDALAVTIEANGEGAFYPVLYARRDGAVTEHPLPGDELLGFDGPEHRRAIADVLAGFGIAADPEAGMADSGGRAAVAAGPAISSRPEAPAS
ncbi:MAG TPA: NAD(P)-binding domain-containing protein [Candidatus Limnocylindrales bacterium]